MDVISPAVDFVTLLGGIITLAGGIIGLFVLLFKVYRRVDGWNESTVLSRAAEEAARAAADRVEMLIGTVDKLAGDVERVRSEVTSNGGTSMKDRVEQLSAQIADSRSRRDDVDRRLDAVERSIDDLAAQMHRRGGGSG